MRILLVNQSLDFSSGTSYTMDLATELMKRGEKVQLCTFGGEWRQQFRDVGIETYKVKYNLFSWWKLIDFLREFNPHLLHVQTFRSLSLGQKLAQKLGKPYIFTVHRRPREDQEFSPGKNLAGVVAVNEVIRESLVNDLGLPKNIVRVIRRGIRFPKPRANLSSSGEIEAHVPVVGIVGRLVPEKGQEFLIRACRRLLNRGVQVHVAIVGEGPDEPRLREIVKDLDLETHVTFSPPLFRRADVYGLFDIVALPVLSSGVGITALEAMAMKKPLIASGVGEMLHVVQDGKTGLLIPEGNAEILADRIGDLIRNPELRITLARNGREWVEKNFALEPMVNETQQFYQEALDESGERSRAAAR
ncbi:MAG: glycosyltransferase family 4 protein [Planctomycetota bacterium]